MGGKYALLVGINYIKNPQARLAGCVNDAYIMKEIVMSKGFQEENIVMMNDEDPNVEDPTGANVKKALQWLCSGRSTDDYIVFHFSGHGTQVPDDDPNNPGQKEEAIVLSDMFLMVDDDLVQFLCNLPVGCQMTVITDCCHSGGMLDHKSVVISGDKRNDAHGAREYGRREYGAPEYGYNQNEGNLPRQLPIGIVANILSEKLGTEVPPTGAGINGSLAQLFGGNAGKLAMSFAVAALAASAGGGQGGQGQGQGLPGLVQGALAAFGSGQGGAAGGGGGLAQMLGSALGGSGPQGNPMAGLIASALGGGSSSGPGGRLQGILAAASAVGGHENLLGMVQNAFQGHQPVTNSGAAAYAPPDSPLSDDVGILVTGCQSNETSADMRPAGGKAYGALTNTIRTVYSQNPNMSYRNLVYGVRALMLQENMEQNPTLECSQRNADLRFIC